MRYKEEVFNVIKNIERTNESIKDKAKKRVDSLAKPLGSLGKLEEIAIKLSGITGKINNEIKKHLPFR